MAVNRWGALPGLGPPWVRSVSSYTGCEPTRGPMLALRAVVTISAGEGRTA